jgi:hypothetical protein
MSRVVRPSEVARLAGIGQLVNQLAGPVQPEDAIGPVSEHGHNRHRLAVGTVTAVVAAECVVRRRDQPRMLPAFVAREGGTRRFRPAADCASAPS